ncbi:Fpg/Nei family DNA glycosylase [Williamsia sp. CHRR-6]|uniref:Fpg/Nei family DNA glycosylase n=1 Tax=Williamsia sp. CHRR-6 TaxID=2835871 RepID=UPI001BD990D4|nr:DNA-formamidopyrimidine glycosylase family protein [Williamsia sp. CHRR-6]MBT0568300.1 Fpg/Nei family DNA glycosylase [Williamsia sp. CHRR-6]
MPEGHTIHRLARLHQRRFRNQQVAVSSPQGRFAEEADELDGQVFTKAEAWGKHLIHHYDSGAMVHVHLGLFGRFSDVKAPMPPPVGEVRMRIEGDTHGGDLRGPTACELFTEEDLDALVSRLGPDPLRADAEPERALRRISRSTRAVGALLMDQKVIAGIGNVYRAEVLFRAGVNPMREGKALGERDFNAIWDDLVDLMALGVRKGKIITIRPEDDHGPGGPRGRPRNYVYRRRGQPCRVCGNTILGEVMEGRNLFWCPSCQPD